MVKMTKGKHSITIGEISCTSFKIEEYIDYRKV